jgi:hypothetical protein
MKIKYPAFVTLKNGKEKLMHTKSDAVSWAKSLKSEIVKEESLAVSAPENYKPSKESIIESHLKLGGDRNDFVDDF